MIIDGDDEEVQDMIRAVEGVAGMKKAHVKKLKRSWRKCAARASSCREDTVPLMDYM